jgi:phospho-N-acetylmuramoyl-pentapeptide-transferase
MGIFQYITFRASASVILSLIMTMIFGKKIIHFLQRKQIGEEVRNLGLDGQMQKKGTPTMGGLIILTSILVPTLLFARLDNHYNLVGIYRVRRRLYQSIFKRQKRVSRKI